MKHLRGINILTGETTLSKLFCHPSEKGSYGELMHFEGQQLSENCFIILMKRDLLLKEEFAPPASKFFHFRVDPFSEGA